MTQNWKSATFIVIFPLWIVILLLFKFLLYITQYQVRTNYNLILFTNTLVALSSVSFLAIIGLHLFEYIGSSLNSCPVRSRSATYAGESGGGCVLVR